jgi:ADP-ribose pyrophosphatase
MFIIRKEHIKTRRRGTACVPTERGILLIQEKRGGRWYFPGGGARHHERSIKCAARELWEETGVRGYNPRHLIDIMGKIHRDKRGKKYRTLYKVFIFDKIDSSIPRIVSEIKGIGFYTPESDLRLANTTREILDAYFKSLEE